MISFLSELTLDVGWALRYAKYALKYLHGTEFGPRINANKYLIKDKTPAVEICVEQQRFNVSTIRDSPQEHT
jgi:hypothetical protein